jgi:hypothetical protein
MNECMYVYVVMRDAPGGATHSLAWVCCALLRGSFVRDRGLACGGGAGGQKAGGATPVRKVSRHALRFAASSGQRVLSMRNISSALKMERPYVMDGEPIGRRWGTHAESKRRGSLVS